MATDTIWWTGFCGNSSIYDAFWSPVLSVNTFNPDLSLCMQRTLLLWIPAGWIFLSAPYYIYNLLKLSTVHRMFSFGIFNLLKTVVCALMVAISIGSLVITCLKLTNQEPVPPVDVTYGIIRVITMALVTFEIRLEYMKGLHTSAVLCPFWVLLTFTQIIPARSAFMRRHSIEVWSESEVDFVLDMIFYALLIIELFSSFFSDTSAIARSQKVCTGEKTPLLSSTNDVTEFKTSHPCPELTTSFWMQLTFQWVTPAVLRNYRKAVTFDDLCDIRPQDSCDTTVPRFYKLFKHSGASGSAFRCAFYWAMFQTVGWPIVWCILLKCTATAIFLANPQLLRLLLAYMSSDDPYVWKVVLIAVMMGIGALVSSLLRQTVFLVVAAVGLNARNVLNAIVCRKALLLSSSAKRVTTVGEMVNLLSVDGQKVQDGFTWLQTLLDIPLTAVVTCILIWNTIGWTAVAGVIVLLIAVPLNGFYFGDKAAKLQGKQMVHKDSRLRMINEILNGIKILKLYAWEPSFMAQTAASRDKELKYLRQMTGIMAISNCIWFILPYLVSLAIFALYVLTTPGHVLNADTAFVTLSYVNSLQLPLSMLPLGVSWTAQGLVSLGRVADFLQLSELPTDPVEKDEAMSDAVQLDDASFSWEAVDARTVLNKISLNVRPGELIAVVGHVGAGKSSLLSAILGELVKVSGQIKVKGNFAYVPQQAWIQNQTLKNNILFDKPFSNRKYINVVEACALTRDLEVLPGGDFTEIGEKGINLSGGQKQRVSLARAVYQDEDIYLLDDPLSAVDAHVGKHIFEKVIGKKGILKQKTRILVTHAITFLPNVDKIVVLNDGHVTEVGQYEELLQNNGAFADYLRTYLIEEGSEEESSAPEYVELRHQLSVLSGTESEGSLLRSNRQNVRQRRLKLHKDSQLSAHVDSVSTKIKQDSRLIYDEVPQEGQMNPKVIWAYIQAGGFASFLAVVTSMVIFAVSQVLTNIWLSEWTNDVGINGSVTQEHASYRLGVYGGLGVLQAVSAVLMMGTVALGCTAASRALHATMLLKIMRAPMAFFDTNPLGRIMNRFSKDMDYVDSSVPIFLMVWIYTLAPMLSAITLIAYTTPIFLVIVAVLAVPYLVIMRVCIVYASQLRRIESVRKSPIYAHFEETVMGASSIRAYRRKAAFIKKADKLIDDSHRPCYLLAVEQRMLGVVVETIAAIVIFVTPLLAGLQRDNLDPGMAGMSVTYALQLTIVFNVLVRSCMELETYMISVERVDEYRQIPSEAPWDEPGDDSSQLSNWPHEGALAFNAYGTRYRPGLDLVLSEVNINIAPGEKVGVVGRTGAGKSSLTLALFRIIEGAQGQIMIDGEDISKLGLHKLRSRLTVIPQDPVMFSGSLRMNLDPFGMYSDLDLWEALEHAHLKSFVETLEEGLDYNCGEGGDALSIGQRQLVCLARALLRQSRILILDEATAAVDMETDALIQASIQRHFDRCTVITVAHRLNTVLDYDRILVLEGGSVKEFDSPTNLLATRASLFYSLAKEAGLTS